MNSKQNFDVSKDDDGNDEGSCNCDPYPAYAVGGTLGTLIVASRAAHIATAVYLYLSRKRAKIVPVKAEETPPLPDESSHEQSPSDPEGTMST